MSRESPEEKRVFQSIVFTFLGKGSFSKAFIATLDRNREINGQKFLKGQKIVYKEIRSDDESASQLVVERESKFKQLSEALQKKEEPSEAELEKVAQAGHDYTKALAQSELDSNERLIRLWNTYNKNLEFPAQAFGRGYIVPYIEGDVPSYEEIADFCLDFFTEHQRVILDSQVQDNFRRMDDDRIVPIDFGQFLLVSIEKEVLMKSAASLNYVNFFRELMSVNFKNAIDQQPELTFIFNVTKALFFLQENFPGVKDVSALKDNRDFINTLAAYYDAVKVEVSLAKKEKRAARQFHFNEVRQFFGLPELVNSDHVLLDFPTATTENPFFQRLITREKENCEKLIQAEKTAKNSETREDQLDKLAETLLNKESDLTRIVRLKRNILIALVENPKTAAYSLERLIETVKNASPSDQWVLKRIVKNPNMTQALFEKLIVSANKKLLIEIKFFAEKKLSGDALKAVLKKIDRQENIIEEKIQFEKIKNNIIEKIDHYLSARFGDHEKRSELSPRLFWNKALIVEIENLLVKLKECADDNSLLTTLVAARQIDKLKDIHGLLSECGQMFIFSLDKKRTGVAPDSPLHPLQKL
ncbi:MAG: hypothetical protein Q8L78_08995 [Coxiellaceae bacterium]|nr:hypothetical protein [Coxiellaceae bacterium]